jgi:hypothetical protein
MNGIRRVRVAPLPGVAKRDGELAQAPSKEK